MLECSLTRPREELQKIHDATIQVLAEVGMRFPDPFALDLLKKFGATIDEKNMIAMIPEHLVDWAIKKAPREFILHSRDGERDIRLGHNQAHFLPGGIGLFIHDLETGIRRESTKQDAINVAKLTDALPNFDIVQIMIEPRDMPDRVHDHYRYEAALNYSTKHAGMWISPATTDEGAKEIIKMASLLVGGLEELRKKPIISVFQAPVSPLGYDKRGLRAIIEYAKHGVPIVITSAAMGGGSAPATVAGEMVVINAETLATLVLIEAVNERNPFVYGNVGCIIDQRSAIFAAGSPERALTNIWAVNLARFYGLPSHASANTDSKVPGAQAGFEKTMNCLSPMLAGVDAVTIGGFLDSASTFSYEQLVIDNELLGALKHIVRGFEINEETLAVDVIKRVGVGRHFLGEKHTMQHVMKEQWFPSLPLRKAEPIRGWTLQTIGELDLMKSAAEKARKILQTHETKPLDPDVKEKIHAIVMEAEKKSRQT